MIRVLRQTVTTVAVLAGLLPAWPAIAEVPPFAPILPKSPQALLLDITHAGKRLVAVGERGIVVFSSDGGRHWTQARVPTTQMLTSVCFADADHGWAVGHDGLILHSSDGGQTWQLQRDGLAVQRRINETRLERARKTVARLAAAQALAKAKAKAKAKTTDADVTALHKQLDEAHANLDDARTTAAEPVSTAPLLAVACTDRRHAWAVGAFGTYTLTTDGRHWVEANGRIHNPEELHYNAVVATDDGRVFIAGEAGTLYRSVDAGNTFNAVHSPYEGSFFGALYERAAGSLLVFGLRGHVYRSNDFGNHWSAVKTGSEVSLAGGAVAGTQVLLVGSVGIMLYSSDDGHSFMRRFSSERVGLSSALHVAGDDWITVGDGGIHHVHFSRAHTPGVSNVETQP